MARPSKAGLDYFPFDISFFQDIKVRKLIKYQGCKAVPVYTLLLCNIYQNGWYMRWDEELPFIISETTGYEEGYVNEVIKCCIHVGLFSEPLFEESKVLSSRGIQERYIMICRQAKRKFVLDEFTLINSEETRVNSEETRVNSEFGTQRKGKESKEKESKEEEEKENFSSPSMADLVSDFSKKEREKIAAELKPDPPELRAAPLTLDDYAIQMQGNRHLIEAACITRKVTEEEFGMALREFILEKKAVKHIPKGVNDIVQHFLSWLAIWKGKRDKSGKGKIQAGVEIARSAADNIRQRRANS